MKKLHFQNTEEFETLFKRKDRTITDTIVSAINEAYQSKKKTAKLFQVSFEDVEIAYDIDLPSTQWELALETCLAHYQKEEESDLAIDTYLLQKGIRQWLS
mgnify:CR=1 FL=1|tara:strand:- start:196 stop:498 length:303 start_codon:yes stop_codon:yes gene_type:complete